MTPGAMPTVETTQQSMEPAAPTPFQQPLQAVAPTAPPAPAKKQTWIVVLAAVAIALVNAGIAYIFAFTTDDGNFYWFLLPGFALLLVLAIIGIVLHNNAARRNPVRERQVMLIIKLGLIPFYLVGGFLMIVFAMMPGGILGSLLFSAGGWLLMLTGSAWGICYALSLKRAGVLSAGSATALIIMQVFFVLDVVAALILFFCGRTHFRYYR